MYGNWIKGRRLELDLTLREFCRLIDEDPSNWSKVERNIINPPQDSIKLKKIAEALNIQFDSEEYREMVDLAQVSAGKIPDSIKSDHEIMNSLPAFLRTIGNVKPTPEEIDKLVELIKKEKV
jgi:transcriptional regulator with XRE-family HTH domain